MQVFKGKEVTFTRKIVRRWFRLLQKNWPSTPAFQVGHLNTISAPWGGNFNKPIYKIKRAGGSPSEDAEASKWCTIEIRNDPLAPYHLLWDYNFR